LQVGHDIIVREMKGAGKKIGNGVRVTGNGQDPCFHLCMAADKAKVAKDEG